jgi:tRNA(fMet)-specific endonuclease VapC
VLDAVSQADSVLLPATVIGELEAGLRVGHRYMENRHSLDEFLREPFVSIVPVDREVAGRYGEVFAALKAKGRPIPVNDMWIAAATLVTGARLVTFDEDFSNVEQLPQTLFR